MQFGADKPLLAANRQKADGRIEKLCLRGLEAAANFGVGMDLFEEDADVIDFAQKDLAEVETEFLHDADIFFGGRGKIRTRSPCYFKEIRIDGVEERQKDIELVLEVAVNRAVAGVEARSDVGYARRVVTLFGKDIEGGLQNRFALNLLLLCRYLRSGHTGRDNYRNGASGNISTRPAQHGLQQHVAAMHRLLGLDVFDLVVADAVIAGYKDHTGGSDLRDITGVVGCA